MWPMFAFGFGGVFVITQMHGLKIPKWLRWTFLGEFILPLPYLYTAAGILSMIHQVTWIPVIDYLAVFLLAGVLWVFMKVFKNFLLIGVETRPHKGCLF